MGKKLREGAMVSHPSNSSIERRIVTNLLKDAKLMKTSAVGCAAQAASMLQVQEKTKKIRKNKYKIDGCLLGLC